MGAGLGATSASGQGRAVPAKPSGSHADAFTFTGKLGAYGETWRGSGQGRRHRRQRPSRIKPECRENRLTVIVPVGPRPPQRGWRDNSVAPTSAAGRG